MKRLFFYCLVLFLFTQCDKEERTRNPFLYERGFSFKVNTRLPKYIKLQNPPHVEYIGVEGVGIKGVYLVSLGLGNYVAWEASCPNLYPKDCNKLEIEGLTAKCPCTGNVFSLSNGAVLKNNQKGKPYPLLNYNVSVNNDIITISN